MSDSTSRFKVQGKRALVTGASPGIGADIATLTWHRRPRTSSVAKSCSLTVATLPSRSTVDVEVRGCEPVNTRMRGTTSRM